MPVRMLPPVPLTPQRFRELDRMIRGTATSPTREPAVTTPQPALTIPPAGARPPVIPRVDATAYLLYCAYARPCFVCAKQGPCQHREPEVEIALLVAAGRY
jgi:hypothetical protein